MTYCAGTLVDQGIVLLSDSRTNAGIDNVSTFRKMHVYERRGDRVLVLLTAGNLAITQAVVGLLDEAAADPRAEHALMHVATMLEAVRLVGDAVRQVYARDAASLREHGIEFNASFILAGQIGTEAPRLFEVYSAGNFIEATAETPYLQIGESKYGKPMLDRVVRASTTLEDAAKCLLISMDSTMRSNLSVGPPLDLVVYRRDSLCVGRRMTLAADDPYLLQVRDRWNAGLVLAFDSVPAPPWA